MDDDMFNIYRDYYNSINPMEAFIENLSIDISRMCNGKDPMNIDYIMERLETLEYQPKIIPRYNGDFKGLDALKEELVKNNIIHDYTNLTE